MFLSPAHRANNPVWYPNLQRNCLDSKLNDNAAVRSFGQAADLTQNAAVGNSLRAYADEKLRRSLFQFGF